MEKTISSTLLGCRTLMVYYIGRFLNHLVVEPSSKVRLRLGCWLPLYFGGVPAIHPIFIHQLLDEATIFIMGVAFMPFLLS